MVLVLLLWELASELGQARVVEREYSAHMDSSNRVLLETEMQTPA